MKAFAVVLPAVSMVLAVSSCTKDEATPEESLAPSTPTQVVVPVTEKPATEPPASASPQTKKNPELPKPAPITNCRTLGSSPDAPFFIREANLIATRFTRTCTTAQGALGVTPDASWLAMGIPCTGGNGRVKTDDNYYSPKFVTFVVSTDCPMQPASLESARIAGNQAMGLDEKATLIAYNPLAVQYWEVPGFPDADVGFTIDLRSLPALQTAWPKLTKREPLQVKLYGRENAWTAGNGVFAIDAEIVLTADKVFRLVIREGHVLHTDEFEQVKARCEALRPKRSCEKVF